MSANYWNNMYGAADLSDPRGIMGFSGIGGGGFGGGAPAAAPVAQTPVTGGAGLGQTFGPGYGQSPLNKNGPLLATKEELAGAGKGGAGFWGNFSNIMDGVGSLGQLLMGIKSLGIAKDQLAFSKEAYKTNLANQTKSYNTALEDRIRSRYVTEGKSSADADSYLSRNNL